jgi:transcriptional regulator with XRE-family HTH domain
MGTWLKELLEKRHINNASVARGMGVTSNTFQSYFAATQIGDEVLKKITAAIGFDLYTLAKEEQARRTVGPQVVDSKAAAAVEEPSARYGHVRANGKDAWLMTLNLDDFDEGEQLKIVRFLQQLPRKGQRRDATGS